MLKRIALLTRSLDYGGTETQLTTLANGLAHSGYSVVVIVFYPGGPLCKRLSSDVIIRSLEKRGRWDVIGFLRSLFRVLNEEQPDVLYAFLPLPNLLACFTKLRSSNLKIMWGIRASDVDLTCYDWLSRLTYWLERRFSHCPNMIISNSKAGRQYAVSHGFPNNERFIVIPNGIDVDQFHPDAGMRTAVREEWGIQPHETLIGTVARLDPMKDYPNFLEAAAKLARRGGYMRFVSVGAGPEAYTAALREQTGVLGLTDQMIWAGPRGDLPAVYNALDILVSSSAFGEGFSNVLGESLACGVPCIATDVGDAREILGECGAVVPPRNSEALVEGIMDLLERSRLDRANLGAVARRRAVENFSVERLIARTEVALGMMA
jgi:glycosyltransferase involved in cell wall biosynthesis